MKIKVIDYGYKNLPKRAHYNDVGADVYVNKEVFLWGHCSTKVPLGFGLEMPNGYGAFIFPRSGLSSKGITTELAPIDSGYTGEIFAIVNNHNSEGITIKEGERIGQLVILPVVVVDFVTELGENRGDGAFGSTGN